jgi:alpha-glucuronidase
MKSGRTLWDEICYHYETGLQQVREFQKIWDKVEPYVDTDRFILIQSKLRSQCANAQVWKDACLLFFQQFSRMPIPYDLERPVNNLEDLIRNDMRRR